MIKIIEKILKRYKQIYCDFSRIYKELIFAITSNSRKEVIYVKYEPLSNTLEIKGVKCFQSRSLSSIKMLIDALKKLNQPILQPIEFVIQVGDYPVSNNNSLHQYAYCCDSLNKVDLAIPDHVFAGWTEAGIQDYTALSEQIASAGTIQPTDERIFWIGNSGTHSTRSILIELSQKHPKAILAIDTKIEQARKKEGGAYYSLPDHCKFKYLIDVEGRGYSGRLKLLLFTQRLVFVQERRWKEWFQFELEPYYHFIPVKNDLSDLIDKYFEIESDDEIYRKISKNAYDFARTHLTYERAVERFASLIEKDFLTK